MKEEKPFKLCIATPSFSGGGAERIAVNLANEYTAQGHDVTLLVLKDKGPYKSQLNPSVKVHIVGLDRGYKILIYLIKYFRKADYTHVLSVLRGTNIFVGLALLFNFKPKLTFREANELNAINQLSIKQKLKFLMRMKLAYFRANLVLANANKTKQDLINFNIVGSSKIEVVHNPVLANSYIEKLEKSVNFIFEENKYYFLNVGRYHYQKNQALLIDAFSIISNAAPNAHLLILGEGEEKDNLENQINTLNLSERITLVPFQDNPFPFYKNSDCFVLSSRWEGFGNVIVESLAAGTPVISTACGGPKDILQNNKYGVLVENESVEALASAMLNMINGKTEYSTKDLKARAVEFTVENKAAEYLQHIRGI